MTLIRATTTIALATLALQFVGAQASANIIQISNGAEFSTTYDNGGMGGGRGVSFLANNNFSISSVGIDLDITTANATAYVYQIFSSTDGQTPNALLASQTFTLGAGPGYRDQAFNYSFNAGSYYVVNFARSDADQLGTNVGTHYAWISQGDQTAPYNYGPFTTVKGFEGSTAQDNNPLLPYMELNVSDAVPEPASWTMMIVGLGLVGVTMRRRQAVNGIAS